MVGVRRALILTFFVGCTIARADNEDLLKDVEKRIVALAQKHTSMTADVVMHAAWEDVDIKVRINKTGTYEYQRQKNRIRSRQELHIKGLETVGEEKTPFEQTELTISDGRFVYKLTDKEGIKSIVKTRFDARRAGRIDERMFKRWHEEYDLSLLPSMRVAGRDAWVIDAKSKKQDDAETWHDRFYFDKETGIMIRDESLNAKGELIQSREYQNVRLGVEIDSARFEFTPPEDVNVVDRTRRKKSRARR